MGNNLSIYFRLMNTRFCKNAKKAFSPEILAYIFRALFAIYTCFRVTDSIGF